MQKEGKMSKEVTITKAESMGKDEMYCEWFKCPECGDTNVAIDSKYCPECGAKITWAR